MVPVCLSVSVTHEMETMQRFFLCYAVLRARARTHTHVSRSPTPSWTRPCGTGKAIAHGRICMHEAEARVLTKVARPTSIRKQRHVPLDRKTKHAGWNGQTKLWAHAYYCICDHRASRYRYLLNPDLFSVSACVKLLLPLSCMSASYPIPCCCILLRSACSDVVYCVVHPAPAPRPGGPLHI